MRTKIMQLDRSVLVAVAALLIVVGGLSFWAGKKSTVSAVPVRGSQAQGAGGTGAGRRFGAGGGFASGVVSAKDAQSITVTLNQGGSRIIFFGKTTEVGKSVAGSIEDVVIGKNVMANGIQNPDGSISATSIQIRPAGAPTGPRGQ